MIQAGDDAMQIRVGGNRIVGNWLGRSAVRLFLQHAGRGPAGNDVLGNVVLGSTGEGIVVSLSSKGNRIIGNDAHGNKPDLAERHPDCDANLWVGNVFEKADPEDCIR